MLVRVAFPISALLCVLVVGEAPAADDLRRAVRSTTYSALAKFAANCTRSQGTSVACRSAISRYCQSLKYVSGFGPLESSSDGVLVACLGGADVKRFLIDFPALTAQHSACASTNPTSNECHAAINRFCRKAGYPSGGYGPEELSGQSLWVACVRGNVTRQLVTSTRELDAELAGGCATGFVDIGCKAAVHRVCTTRGYLTGFGPLEGDETSRTHACVEKLPATLKQDPRYGTAAFRTLNWENQPRRRIQLSGLNAVRHAQVPGQPNLFFGRLLIPEAKGSQKISLVTRSGNGFKYQSDVVKPPVRITAGADDEAHEITTAYDPTTFSYLGDTWVAFECHGRRVAGGPGVFGSTVGTCAGPVDTKTWRMDPTRTTLVVRSSDDSQHVYSASVPKLLLHQGRPYLYWTVVRMNRSDRSWVHITSRGVELQRESGGRRRLLAKGWRAAIPANHPDTTLVWGLGDAPRSNQVADVFDVDSDGRYVYATAAVGGTGCLKPLDTTPGCYRLAVARTLAPLKHRGFSDAIVNDTLPHNPHEYSTIITNPNGGLSLLAQFIAPIGPSAIPSGPHEIDLAPAAASKTLASACDPSLQPSPHWNTRLGVCLPSCGGVGGTASFPTSCAARRLQSAGASWDAEFCCR